MTERRETKRGRQARRLQKSRAAWVGGAIVALFLLIALAANWVSPYPPDKLVADPFLGCSAEHWFGTDSYGHDVLARVLFGTRLSLAAGAVSIALAIVIGVPLGAVCGYAGGWFDLVVMRTVDVMLTFPAILVALALVVAFSPGQMAVMLAIAFVNMPVFCRQVRATVLTVRHQDYVMASRAAGAGVPHILWHVIAPSLVSPVLVLATLGLGTAILEVAGLSFLGVSGEPDAAEWGAMLKSAKDSLTRAPACTWLAPGGAITLAVLGFSLLGDGLRDALEPR